ncbi:MAG: RIP metalloprotease RseP, partial [Acidobacteria bacterium]|nr:RIP metalloprotease RseP [Acidobacteriota bacterium]
AVVLYQGAQVPAFDQDAVVIGSVTENSVAARAGIRPGDRIVRIDGVPVPTWERFSVELLPKANRHVTLTIEHDGRAIEQSLVPAAVGKFEMADIGVFPVMHPEIQAINPGEPAHQGGLQPRDVIMAANGEPSVSRERVIELIKSHADRPLTLDVVRGGEPRQVTVTPRKIGQVVMIGAQIAPYETRMVEPGVLEAISLSVQRNWEWSKLIVKTLSGLLTRDTSVKQLMGPVAIADLSGTAAEAGWIPLFGLMAMISLNLGLLNLMPIPVLDGGHIAILALEGLSRRDFSMKVKEKMLLAGFVLLLMLMVTVIYNDLTRVQWIERLMPWR